MKKIEPIIPWDANKSFKHPDVLMWQRREKSFLAEVRKLNARQAEIYIFKCRLLDLEELKKQNEMMVSRLIGKILVVRPLGDCFNVSPDTLAIWNGKIESFLKKLVL